MSFTLGDLYFGYGRIELTLATAGSIGTNFATGITNAGRRGLARGTLGNRGHFARSRRWGAVQSSAAENQSPRFLSLFLFIYLSALLLA
jgi:hypothetical protein